MALFHYFSLFQQIFIVSKTFTVGIKTKNVAGMIRFGFWLFYNVALKNNHLSKTTILECSQDWLSYAGLTWYINIH